MSIPSDPRQWRVGLVGYGEVGRILAEDLSERSLDATVASDTLGVASATKMCRGVIVDGGDGGSGPVRGKRRPA